MNKNKVSYVGMAVPSELKKNWKLYKYPDRVILQSLIKKGIKFDIVHYTVIKVIMEECGFIKKYGVLLEGEDCLSQTTLRITMLL